MIYRAKKEKLFFTSHLTAFVFENFEKRGSQVPLGVESMERASVTEKANEQMRLVRERLRIAMQHMPKTRSTWKDLILGREAKEDSGNVLYCILEAARLRGIKVEECDRIDTDTRALNRAALLKLEEKLAYSFMLEDAQELGHQIASMEDLKKNEKLVAELRHRKGHFHDYSSGLGNRAMQYVTSLKQEGLVYDDRFCEEEWDPVLLRGQKSLNTMVLNDAIKYGLLPKDATSNMLTKDIRKQLVSKGVDYSMAVRLLKEMTAYHSE